MALVRKKFAGMPPTAVWSMLSGVGAENRPPAGCGVGDGRRLCGAPCGAGALPIPKVLTGPVGLCATLAGGGAETAGAGAEDVPTGPIPREDRSMPRDFGSI